MRPKDKSRLLAAVLFAMLTFFFGVIVYILGNVGGEVAMSTLVAEGSPARTLVFFLLGSIALAAGISLALFFGVVKAKQHRLILVVVAVTHATSSFFFAPFAVAAYLVPLWSLVRFYRESVA